MVTTASATALIMLPLVIMGARPGYELVHPLAIVVIGGLVTSTWLTLFVMPALYLRFGFGTVFEGPEAPARGDLTTVLAPASPTPAPTANAVVEKEAMPDPAS